MFEVAAAVPQRVLSCGLPFFSAHADIKAFEKLKIASVYAIGPASGGPIKVGWATRPDKRLNELQVANWKELKVHEVTWTQGTPTAKALEKEIHRILTKGGRHIRGEWFDVPVGLVLATFDVATRNLKLPTMTHDGMLERFEQEKRRLLLASLDQQPKLPTVH